jgi:N-acetylglucosamine-6-phosphate deacetylase
MEQMVRVMHEASSASLAEVIRMASLTPAERVGLDQQVGSLGRGKLANVLVLSLRLKVQQVFVREKRIV